jgi:hypothetical protein
MTASREWIAIATRLLLVLTAALAVAVNAVSETVRDTAPPAPPKFVRPAHAMFVDDFTDGSLRAWTADEAAAWSVRDGILCADLPDGKQRHSFLYAGDSSWVDYAVDFDVCGMRGVDKGCAIRVEPGRRGLGVDLRGPGFDDLKLYVNQFPVGSAAVANANGAWHHMRIEIRGRNRCRVAIDGSMVLDQHLRPPAPARGAYRVVGLHRGSGNVHRVLRQCRRHDTECSPLTAHRTWGCTTRCGRLARCLQALSSGLLDRCSMRSRVC